MIIENISGNIKNYQIGNRNIEKVILDRDRMLKPHQKVTSENGETFAISLPHGTTLSPGDVIFADDKRVVVVELTAEDALVICPEGQMQWARAAYNIGNMHQTAYIQDDCIVTPYDAILESVMQRLEVKCERAARPIDGVRANVAQNQGHHHHHDHDHGHDHDHVHSHEHVHCHDHDHEHHHDKCHGHRHTREDCPGPANCSCHEHEQGGGDE